MTRLPIWLFSDAIVFMETRLEFFVLIHARGLIHTVMTTFVYLYRWNVWRTSTNDGSLRHDHAPYGSPFNGMFLYGHHGLSFWRLYCHKHDCYLCFPGAKARIFPWWQVPEKRLSFLISLEIIIFFVIVLFFYYWRKLLTHCLVLWRKIWSMTMTGDVLNVEMWISLLEQFAIWGSAAPQSLVPRLDYINYFAP